MNDLPLSRHQPLERFSNRASDYARFRPGYPEAALDTILADVPQAGRAADIGAGTGISARALAARGLQITAIEPNTAMRQAAAPHPGVVFQDGTAERTGLADHSQDLVSCFQSFHWFDSALSLPEFRRILRARGRLALVWNDRDEADPFTAAYGQFVREASSGHPAAERANGEAVLTLLQEAEGFAQVGQHNFVSAQELDFEALVGRVRSSSYIPLDSEAQEALHEQLLTLYRTHADPAGLVHLHYNARVFLAETAG